MSDLRLVNIALELWSAGFCLACFFACLLLVRTRGRQSSLVLVGLSLEFAVALCDALALMYRDRPGSLARAMTQAGNALSFILSFFLVATLTSYLCERIDEEGGGPHRRWRRAAWAAAGAMSVCTLLGGIFHMDAANGYHRSSGFWLVPAYTVVINGTNAMLALRARRELGATALACVLFYSLAPLVAVVVQAVLYDVDLAIVAAVFGFVVIFLEMQAHTAEVLQRRTEDLARAEADAADSRIRVMVSQIQPHFIFNTLDTIYALIDIDAARAKRAISSFSRYLRRNLATLGHASPVPIAAEIEHVRTYLELERMADEDKIFWEIDDQAGGFAVPSLSVQTLAENAVKHGISKTERGGHVVIRTREAAGEYTVSVIDDGVGFDVEAALAQRGHVGLANTRERLSVLCGGTLDVASRPGEGTTVVMHIPKTFGGGCVPDEDPRRR